MNVQLRRLILEEIATMSEEELYRNNKVIKLSKESDGDVISCAYQLYKEGLIDAAIMKHNLGIEGVIPKGLTKQGRDYLEELRKSYISRIFDKVKSSFEDKLADRLASFGLILMGMFLMFILVLLYGYFT